MRKRKCDFIEYIAMLIIGILVALLLPLWMCFCIIVGLIIFICFLM